MLITLYDPLFSSNKTMHTLHINFLLDCSLIKGRSNRAAMQMGKNLKTSNEFPLREVSAAVTMISLVTIYTVANVPMICLWAIFEALSLLSPTSYLIIVLFNAAQFSQVSVFPR